MSSAPSSLPDALGAVLLDPAEASAVAVHGRTKAAVLVALYVDSGDLYAVFTRRRHDLRSHAGEISFPGGRRDPDEDLRTTALRESEEEIGLPRDAVELAGALPPVGTFVTSYKIFPFVGVIEAGHRWTPEPREVDEVLELSLRALVEGFEMQRLLRKGVPIKTPTYTVGRHFVWGATARIVQELLGRLAPVLG